MKRNNSLFLILVCAILVGAVWSCTKVTETDENDLLLTEQVTEIQKNLYEGGEGEIEESSEQEEDVFEADPRVVEYCVGKITKVYFVAEGDEKKYKVGATICNRCDDGQTTCKASYKTRVRRNGVHIATIKVENNPLNCTACPAGGIKIH